jgi:hypothetical protein
MDILPPSSRQNSKPSTERSDTDVVNMRKGIVWYCLHKIHLHGPHNLRCGCILVLVPLLYVFDIPFYPEDRGNRFLRNIGSVLSDNNVSYMWEPLVENVFLRHDRLLTALPAVQATVQGGQSLDYSHLQQVSPVSTKYYERWWNLWRPSVLFYRQTVLMWTCISSEIARKEEGMNTVGVEPRTKCLGWSQM